MSPRTAKDATKESIQRLAELNLEKSMKIQQLQAMIFGLWDAMKPLIDEIKSLEIGDSDE